jgi:predicted ester cyclase
MANKESTLLYRWFNEVWNNNNDSMIDELLDENVITHGLKVDAVGREPFRNFHSIFTQSFEDIHVDAEHVVAEDDYEVIRCVVDALHKASGKKVKFPGIVMVKVKDGKISEAWNNFDFLEMHEQLGQKLV